MVQKLFQISTRPIYTCQRGTLNIKEIAKTAGLTSGLVHYYFESKEEILSEVLLHASQLYTQKMKQLVSTVSQDELGRAALIEPMQRAEKNQEWYQLRYELFSIGLRNESLRPAVKNLLDNGREGISAILVKVLGQEAESLQELSSIFLACFDGLALQKLLDPNFDIEKAYAILERIVMEFYRSPS